MGDLAYYQLNGWHLSDWLVRVHDYVRLIELAPADNTSVAAQAWQRFDTDPVYRKSCPNRARISRDRQA